MTLAGRLILATTLLTLLTTLLLGLGVRQAWRSAEEQRFEAQFRAATRELQAELLAQTDELKGALEARCLAESSVDSALIGLKAQDLDERRLGLSLQIDALMKLLQADELVLLTSSGEVLGAGHQKALVGQRSEELRKLTLALNGHAELRKAALPLSIHAACVHRDASQKVLWVGLYGARHLERILSSVAGHHGIDLRLGKTDVGSDLLRESAVLDGLGGLPVTASQSRQPLILAMSVLDGTILLIAAITLVIAGSVAYFLSRGIARPIEELSEQARVITAADPKPVRARGSRELHELAAAFNQTLSELAASRKRLAKAERLAAQREIARRVAHEIKNPLSPIQAAIETLRRLRSRNDPAFDGYFDEATRTVLEEVKRISNIVTEFTQFARLPEPHPTDLDLNATLLPLLTLYQTPGITLHTDLSPTATLRADRDQLIQVFTNLLKNAAEAAKANVTPEIWVKLQSDDSKVRLSVRDNGPGLDPAIEGRLFEPYVSNKPDGTGLGLAIAERIVEEHGGTLRHVRPSAGGAEFVMELPILAGSMPPREASSGQKS